MKKLSSTLCATAMAFSIAGGATIANAGSGQAPKTVTEITDTTVQQYGHYRKRRFERRGDRAYYGGHRGYRKYRRGHRRYNGYWFPPVAFLGGVIIGNSLSSNYNRNDGYRLHAKWCDDRYISYRVSDDTFQPYHGPRRRCNSPYN